MTNVQLIRRRATSVDDLGHMATNKDLLRWERILARVIWEGFQIRDYQKRDAYEYWTVAAVDFRVAEEIVEEYIQRAWNRFCDESHYP